MHDSLVSGRQPGVDLSNVRSFLRANDMREFLPFIQAILSVALTIPLLGHAYSGAGAECGDGKLEAAAMKGQPTDLEGAVDAKVLVMQDVVSKWSRGIAKRNPDTTSVWLDPMVRKGSPEVKRAALVKWWTGCQGINLLDAAVAGANLENVKRLLLLGADPNTPFVNDSRRTILMRCPVNRQGRLSVYSIPPTRTPEETKAVVAAYYLLLQAGADVQQSDQLGLTALHLCKDPAVVELLIQHGADISVGIDPSVDPATIRGDSVTRRVLDYRVREIATNGPTWDREMHFAVLEQITPLLKDVRVTAETERLVSWGCKESRNMDACARLSKMIAVRDNEIFKPLDQRNPIRPPGSI